MNIILSSTELINGLNRSIWKYFRYLRPGALEFLLRGRAKFYKSFKTPILLFDITAKRDKDIFLLFLGKRTLRFG